MSEVRYSVTEVTVSKGKQATIKVNIDGVDVRIPVAPEVRAYFQDQFVRDSPSALQRKKFATLMHVIRAAYKKGLADGKSSQP